MTVWLKKSFCFFPFEGEENFRLPFRDQQFIFYVPFEHSILISNEWNSVGKKERFVPLMKEIPAEWILFRYMFILFFYWGEFALLSENILKVLNFTSLPREYYLNFTKSSKIWLKIYLKKILHCNFNSDATKNTTSFVLKNITEVTTRKLYVSASFKVVA